MLNERFFRAMLMLPLFGAPVVADGCSAVDFMEKELPQTAASNQIATALSLAYVDVHVSTDHVEMPDGTQVALGQDTNRAPKIRMQDATVLEQFHDVYPLGFDLNARAAAWHDPGRARSDAFFRGLYGDRSSVVRGRLERVKGPQHSRFLMNNQQNISCQMQAALEALTLLRSDEVAAFSNVGGSFNWRVIAGTQRLSAHSFGIAFDLNANLGGYWRWSGETEGQVGSYANKIPQRVVETFERFGFIWGGKWHHYDGMHFEYRPELILHARLLQQ